jgi:4-amino-4-deoxy-L-arabinose transferase-like glycosyltransferase
VLAGNWLLLYALKRKNIWLALAAGVALGIACWLRVNPLYLCVFWAVALFVLVKDNWPLKLKIAAAALAGTIEIIAPIVIRNFIVFPDFTPTGGTIGVNLWEGLGETEFGRQNGFLYGDDKMLAVERARMGRTGDTAVEIQFPDGIRRDKERTRESLAFIRQHPIWYGSVMLGRMWGMLKVAGDPVPHTGICGINVTSQKCLPERWQHGVLAFGVNALGMIQSVVRYLFLPLAAFGIYAGMRTNWRMSWLMLATVLYYLVPGTAAHTEIRYVLPMHGLLIVFASVGIDYLIKVIRG